MSWMAEHWLGMAVLFGLAGYLSWKVCKRMKAKRRRIMPDVEISSSADSLDIIPERPVARELGGGGSGGGAGSSRSFDVVDGSQPTIAGGQSNLMGAVLADDDAMHEVAATTAAENIAETASAVDLEGITDTIVEVAQEAAETIGETVVEVGSEIVSGVLNSD